MTFLNPLVLFGLAAAAIPILIHLFNIRKLRTIDFSTLTFLKELNKNTMRKIKIRQWLLLILRTLLILLIVLAFSRPALRGNFGALSSSAPSTIVIVLDNSASMSLNNERGSFLSQAQSRALEIVAALNDKDEIYFFPLSDLPNAVREEPFGDLRALENAIRETEITVAQRTIDDGLRFASRFLQRSRNANKEIYVLTDGKLSAWKDRSVDTPAAESLFPPETKLFFARFSEEIPENVSVERVTIPPSLFSAGKPFTLAAVIKNYGQSPSENHLVSVVLDRRRVMQKSVSLDPGQTATVEFSVTPARAGILNGSVEMEDDVFGFDDTHFFTVVIPGRINTTLLSTDPDHGRFITAAVRSANADRTLSEIALTLTSPLQLSSAVLASTDVLVLSGISEMPEPQQDLLRQYLTGGGTVMFFPSSDTAAVRYRFLRQMGLTDWRISRTPAQFGTIDQEFPLFRGMFDESIRRAGTSVESPEIALSAAPSSTVDIQPVIGLTNGLPFLWQKKIGKGIFLGWSVPANTTWSDLPLRSIFVPLIVQSVLYLASPLHTAPAGELTAGERLEFGSRQFRNTGRKNIANVTVIDPNGRQTPLQSYTAATDEQTAQTIYTVESPVVMGHYHAIAGMDTLLSLPLNISRRESDGSHAEESDIRQRLAAVGIDEASIASIDNGANLRDVITQSRFGIELWKYLLIAALAIALAEMYIAREPKQT